MLAMPAFRRAMAASRSLFGLVDRFHRQAHALLVLKGQFACGLEDAARVNGLDFLGHWLLHSQSTASRTLMQLRPTPAVFRAGAAPQTGAGSCGLGNGNQRGEMAVPMTEFKGLDAARACGHGLIEHVGFRGGESRLAILFPHAIQGLESRC